LTGYWEHGTTRDNVWTDKPIEEREKRMQRARVGLIGLGFMGSAVGRRLIEQGFSLTAFDIVQEAVARMVERGAAGARSAREVAAASDVVLTVLPDGPDVEAAVQGPEGVLAGAHPGVILVECSTIDPVVSDRVGHAVRHAGFRMLDAAIGRLPTHAEKGQLVFMVGAYPEDLQAVRPILEALSTEIFHCGGPPSGITMKLINNLLASSVMAASSEALVLGVKAGLTPEVMLQVLSSTAADNASLHSSIPQQVLTADYRPGFKSALAHKDMGLAHTMAARLGVPLFTLAPIRQLTSAIAAQGKGELSAAVIATVLENLSGVSLAKQSRAPGHK
jgi:3-hydroxyisobutyrate dehydrogenase-like beta-hydroxyacid dehydrogenase